MRPALVLVDSPLRTGLTAGVVATGFVLARLVVAAQGNIGRFIVIGTVHSDPSKVPAGVPVRSVLGYDGQFYYRLALDPLDWSRVAFGIRLDSYARIGRIGYPALVWLASAGRAGLVPTMLVAVNIVAIAVLAGMSAALAREAGRHPAWGLLIPAYWGFVWSISRDLTEIVAIVLVVGCLLALRHDRPVVGAFSLAGAVLVRETEMVVVAALFFERVITWWRSREPERILAGATPGASRSTSLLTSTPRSRSSASGGDTSRRRRRRGALQEQLPWALPVVVFCGWQAAVRAGTGHIPVRASGGANGGAPFVGIAHGLGQNVAKLPSTGALLWFAEVAVLLAMGVMAALSFRTSTALLHEWLSWVGFGLLTICLSTGIWAGDVGFRSLDDFYVFSCLLILFSGVRLRVAGLLSAVLWLVVVVELIRFV